MGDPTAAYRAVMAGTSRRKTAAPKRHRKASPKKTTRRATSKTTPPLPTPGPGERLWVLDVPYGTRLSGARYYSGVKAHLYVGARLPREVEPYASGAYTYERLVEDSLNGSRGPGMSAPALKPYPKQVEGARAIVRAAQSGAPMFLLGDDTGVGKTITAVLGAKAIARMRGARRVLVIADRPAAITIGHWRRTIAGIGDGDLTWCVTTWDRVAKVAGMKWDIVVADEAQSVKSTETKRWKKWALLAGYNRATPGPFVLFASATPGHSPLELPYLAPMFAHAHGEPKKAWTVGYTERLSAHGLHVHKGREWTEDGRERAVDVKAVRSWMTSGSTPMMIHRAAPWGACQVHGLGVTLTPEQRAAYDAEWGDFQTTMRLARRGKDVAKGRAAVLRFRQKAGMVRVDATADWVAAQIDAGRQAAISCQYVETAADPLVEALRERGVDVACIYGQGRFDPEAERLRFQTGAAKAVVFTVAASISLHAKELLPDGSHASEAPRVGVFHQARYSGIQGKQITGRTHRDGQRSNWHVTYAEGTVEEDVAKVMVERYAAATETVGGDTGGLSKIAALLGCGWLPQGSLTDD